MTAKLFENPFRPGAGHRPPYLAGRQREQDEFRRLLRQKQVLENLVLTGLRGTGKTVLLEEFRPIALADGWLWVGAEMSESTSVSEETLATRLITDLAPITSTIVLGKAGVRSIGFAARVDHVEQRLDHKVLRGIYESTPGLVADKIKRVLELAWQLMSAANERRGIVFAYDEAQTLSDHSAKDQFPLALLLDVFQSIQRRGVPFMLVLTGLPTLFPKLVEARTFAERMFRVVVLERLDKKDSRAAILTPIESSRCPVKFTVASVELIAEASAGYPYFIQYICRDVYDIFSVGGTSVPMLEIQRKLDSDFFAGRWARATDRQRELMRVIARLSNADAEFTVQEIVEEAKALAARKVIEKAFSSSHVSQMLSSLCTNGLVYKNRHGRYSFAVPLLGSFVRRQMRAE